MGCKDKLKVISVGRHSDPEHGGRADLRNVGFWIISEEGDHRKRFIAYI